MKLPNHPSVSKLTMGFIALLFGLLLSLQSLGVSALSQDDLDAINGGWVHWVGNYPLNTCSFLPGGTDTASPTQSQTDNAKIIIGVAKTLNIGQQGALIGLMVGIYESHLLIYANTNVPISLGLPHQAVGHDHDSVGVFQQQPQYTWSTIATGDAALNNPNAIAQLMDPAYSAEAFFGSPPGSKAPPALSKGLQNQSNWQSLDPWVAAQKVQRSYDQTGGIYRSTMPQAQSYINQLWDSSPAVALPVPFNVASGSGTTNNAVGFSCASPSGASGDAQQLAQQILDNPNISLGGRLVKQDVQDAANGQPGTAGVMTSSTLLKLILDVAQSHKVSISAIQSGGTGHCGGKPKSICGNADPHYTGDAVDFDSLDGKALTGRDPGSDIIIRVAYQDLPSGSGLGQVQCGPTPLMPAGWTSFSDTCNHLHVQVPQGTP